MRPRGPGPWTVLLLAAAATWTAAPDPARAEDDPFGPSRRVPVPTAPAAPPSAPAAGAPPVAALAPWLGSEDWLCRALAARELHRRSDEGTLGLLAGVLAHEADPRVLAVALQALAGRPREDLLVEGGPALAATLVGLLPHPHPVVRARALRALEPFPPVRLAAQPAAYSAWWAKGRQGLEVEARLAAERRAAARAQARGDGTPAPGETRTASPVPVERYQDLDRIHREGLEVVVCLDSTGSMGEVIEAAKGCVVDLMRRMKALAPRFRVGLVTYDDGATVRVPLTSDETAVEREFRRVVAQGGGDEEEGVDKAVAVAMEGSRVAWSRKALRVILVVGDAPPHEEDVPGMLRRIRESREDPLFESPVRVDTISTADPGEDDGYVLHFREIARAGRGSALRLHGARELVTELLLAPFGAAWRQPLRELLSDLEEMDRAAAEAAKSRR